MYQVTSDPTQHVVHVRLWGLVPLTEIDALGSALDAVGPEHQGHPINLLVDVREFRPETPDVTERIQGLQQAGLRAGVARIAEVVASNAVALQLNRIARESGTFGILQRFWDEESARAWLISNA